MIETKNVSKSFDNIRALSDISVNIDKGRVFGLIGTNGAGKSTFLRILSGVLKQDSGIVMIDNENVYENITAKAKFFYIPDELYFFANATPDEVVSFYEKVYPLFDRDRYIRLISDFELDRKRKINTFSKGMKKQLSIIIGLSAMTDYIFCDETFDGLDPVMRQGVKSLFAGDIADRGFTPVIASHNLRELEDICDTIGLLHKGGMLLSEDLDNVKADIHKVQCVIQDKELEKKTLEKLTVLTEDVRGSLLTITVRGKEEEILSAINEASPVFVEMLPLSLEEIFISETGIEGYDIKKLFFDGEKAVGESS
ncbi:MAG: ABC transporter ATP-binding protein [Lachnospiraceae bacterium]|nr:ABC transporter ATP-binding protein [Lachnospiraceae bacterium]